LEGVGWGDLGSVTDHDKGSFFIRSSWDCICLWPDGSMTQGCLGKPVSVLIKGKILILNF
jgi:hypothetical protein